MNYSEHFVQSIAILPPMSPLSTAMSRPPHPVRGGRGYTYGIRYEFFSRYGAFSLPQRSRLVHTYRHYHHLRHQTIASQIASIIPFTTNQLVLSQLLYKLIGVNNVIVKIDSILVPHVNS